MTKIIAYTLSCVMAWIFNGPDFTAGFVPTPTLLRTRALGASRAAWGKTSLMGPVHMAASPGGVDPEDRVEDSMSASAFDVAIFPKSSTSSETDSLERRIQAIEAEILEVHEEIYSVETKVQSTVAKVESIEFALVKGGSYLGIREPEQLRMEKRQLRKEKLQLRETKRQLREKKQQLREKKQQLWEDKKKKLREKAEQLREEKFHLRPVSGSAAEKLTEFGSSLVDAKISDNVLQLPEGVFFLGKSSLGSTIFVRQCYSEIANIIFAGVRDGNMRNIVVTGTPGIGKSVFSLYLLYLLRAKGETVVLEWKGKWCRFSNAQGVETGSLDEFERAKYMDDHGGWFLCDPAAKPYKGFDGVTVVTVSPSRSRTHEFFKQSRSNSLFMPLWTAEEIEECRGLVYPHIPKETALEAYFMVGGLAREAFNRELLQRRIDRMKERFGGINREYFCNVYSGRKTCAVVTDEFDDLFVAIVPDDTYRAYSYTQTSRVTQEMLFSGVESKGIGFIYYLMRAELKRRADP